MGNGRSARPTRRSRRSVTSSSSSLRERKTEKRRRRAQEGTDGAGRGQGWLAFPGAIAGKAKNDGCVFSLFLPEGKDQLA
jgi:hypothetical protein